MHERKLRRSEKSARRCTLMMKTSTHLQEARICTHQQAFNMIHVRISISHVEVDPLQPYGTLPRLTVVMCSPIAVKLSLSSLGTYNYKSKQCLKPHTPDSPEMAAPRLPFLWPMLWKPQTAPRIRARARAPRPKRSVSTTSYRAAEAPIQRYGKAHEPAPHLREQLEEKTEPTPPKIPHDPAKGAVEEEDEEPESHVATATTSTPASASASTASTADPPPAYTPPAAPKTGEQKPLDSVLHMPGPADEAYKPPHLKTPPYVHHFDTYGLVRQLTKSQYSDAQSISLMKAVRGLLIDNMMLARQGLVSKSNVENETYLFRAACAELKTEIGSLRRREVERMRTERDQLQHEVDILGQKLGQETGSVKDELKGLFDDRKMAVRQEQRSMETKVSFVCGLLLRPVDYAER